MPKCTSSLNTAPSQPQDRSTSMCKTTHNQAPHARLPHKAHLKKLTRSCSRTWRQKWLCKAQEQLDKALNAIDLGANALCMTVPVKPVACSGNLCPL